jgi:hypothetical protein
MTLITDAMLEIEHGVRQLRSELQRAEELLVRAQMILRQSDLHKAAQLVEVIQGYLTRHGKPTTTQEGVTSERRSIADAGEHDPTGNGV